MIRRPPRPTLFPYTTLSRSHRAANREEHLAARRVRQAHDVHRSRVGERVGVDDIATRPAGGAVYVMSLSDTTGGDRKSTRLNSSHSQISYARFCLEKKSNHH